MTQVDAATPATQTMTTAWEELFDAAFATMTHKETQNGNHFQHHLQSHWPHEIVNQSDSRALPSELHKMIVWVMHHQEDAVHLLPEYNKIRQATEQRETLDKAWERDPDQ